LNCSIVFLYKSFFFKSECKFGEQPGVSAGTGREVEQLVVHVSPEDLPQDLFVGIFIE